LRDCASHLRLRFHWRPSILAALRRPWSPSWHPL